MKSFFILIFCFFSFNIFAKQITYSSNSCVQEVCSKLLPSQCDEISELTEIAKICSKNLSGNCIHQTCLILPHYECDDLDELVTIADSCNQVIGDSCLNYFIDHISLYNRDTKAEMLDINIQCKNISPDTINCSEFVCNKLSKNSCDEVSELKDVIKTCLGE